MPKLIRLESVIEPRSEIIQAEAGEISIGREPDNLVVIDSESISRKHAVVTEVDSFWIFRDNRSTNGSFINGIKLTPGQSRLLRHNDVVQVADYPLRYVELNQKQGVQSSNSLLVFYKEAFESNFVVSADSRFAIGGPEGNFFIEGATDDKPQLEISLVNGRFELSAESESLVIVNGLAVSGVTALSDRDEIVVGPYSIVVNDQKSGLAAQQEVGSSAFSSPSPHTPSIDAGPVARTGSSTAEFARGDSEQILPAVSSSPPGVRIGSGSGNVRGGDDGWASVTAPHETSGDKRYIFGDDPEQVPGGMSKTLAIDASPGGFNRGSGGRSSGSGFEMSAARFSNTAASQETREELERRETRLMFLGVLVLISIATFVAYVIKILA